MESTLVLIGLFAVLYFVMIRPQQKRQRQRQEMLGALTVGDEIVTIGGLHGEVTNIGDDYVDLRVNATTVLRFQRDAIARIVGDDEDDEQDAASGAETESS